MSSMSTAGTEEAARKVTANDAVLQPRVHPMKEFSEDPEVQSIDAFCNNCLSKVIGSEALGHLCFGPVMCVKCMTVIKQCQDFRADYPLVTKCKKDNGMHVVKCTLVLLNLNHYANTNSAIANVASSKGSIKGNAREDFIKSYLKSFILLKDKDPWESAFEDPEVKQFVESCNLISEADEVLTKKRDQNNLPSSSQQPGGKGQSGKCTSSIQQKRLKDICQNSAPSSSSTKPLKQTSPVQETVCEGSTKGSDTFRHTGYSTSTKESNTQKRHQFGKNRKSRLHRKENMVYADFIPKNVLRSGDYLVVEYPKQECPTECPNCYTHFDPMLCTVNLSTNISDFMCHNL
ncbi:hypothetical protein GWK47_027711 [Chionoecetes opilio]|uniref:Uncharacterized protein n=1 Tax=Chionoecetes opilio TaxID=41210 RepID=A0A8J8WD84_CHIOP|nr:hypothetical protein GWK47_027711 [Chionoecetes opilio]